ncbi:MAG TPA: sigma-70 family RNA polymerase sigma factor [Chitinophagaceae bacterium]|nr:sigma-70 family RNA polymerase sigma factor [Chitinophagaceae bacterium]
MLATNNDWKGMKEGSKTAFLNIYKENYKILFSYGFSLTCDKEITKDCIQDMFLEIWDTRFSNNSDVENVRSYLCTWLRRKISRIQSKVSKERYSKSCFAESNDNTSSYETLLIAFQDDMEKKERLMRALSHLTKKQLEIIRYKFFENLSYEAISIKTNLTIRTIYNSTHIAVRHLREDIVLAEHF